MTSKVRLFPMFNCCTKCLHVNNANRRV